MLLKKMSIVAVAEIANLTQNSFCCTRQSASRRHSYCCCVVAAVGACCDQRLPISGHNMNIMGGRKKLIKEKMNS